MSRVEAVVTPQLLRTQPVPEPAGGKEGRGRVLIAGGSRATPGAVLLAAEAALRSGAGKLQVATAQSVAPGLGLAIPECMSVGLPESADGELHTSGSDTIVELAGACDAVVLGPGIGTKSAAVALLSQVVPKLDTPLVLDALGLAYVTENPEGLAHLGGRVILSPNPVELARTLGASEKTVEQDMAGHARELATRVHAVVVAGGVTSWVATPDGGLWRDEAGSPGLGVSGSGDVKAGLLGGLLARGAEPARAALWATHVHGRVGESLATRVGRTGFLARELLPGIPRVFVELTG